MIEKEEYTEPTLVTGEHPDSYSVIIYGCGLMPGIVVSSETIRKVKEAEEQRNRDKDKDQRPPKPPRRPNARIGGVALGNT